MSKLSNLKQYKGFITGVTLTAVLALPVTSLAATLQKKITVSYPGVKVVVNGETVTLKDATGNVVEPFIYDGSTYVPLRGVSEALGSEVGYDSSTKTVTITGSGGTGGIPNGQFGGEGGMNGMPGGSGGAGSTDSSNNVSAVAASIASDKTGSTAYSSAAEQTAKVVSLANSFLDTLSGDQKTSVMYDLTQSNASVWSNLPAGAAKRNGITFGSLNENSLNALKALLAQALGENGWSNLKEIMLADEYLSSKNNMWGANLYYVAFLGSPSDSSTWMLQVGGHHYAYNITYNGNYASVTPVFTGTEPQTFDYNGTTYQPLEERRQAMYNMIQSLSSTELSSAKLSSSFDDVLVGPGQDYKFPTSQGLSVSELSDAQKELVKSAITAWVKDTSPDVSEEFLAAYLSDEALSQTKIAWSGSTDSSVHGSYIRIDGPRVWIEFVCQNGVAYPDQIHFHTVWRDKTADYGGSFSG